MKKWLSLIALFSVMAIAGAVSSPSANAMMLNGSVHALKTEQTGLVEKTYYRCWWRNGYRHCGHRYYRRHYYHRYYYRHYYHRPYRWCIGLCWY
jgi:hypothetical protein